MGFRNWRGNCIYRRASVASSAKYGKIRMAYIYAHWSIHWSFSALYALYRIMCSNLHLLPVYSLLFLYSYALLCTKWKYGMTYTHIYCTVILYSELYAFILSLYIYSYVLLCAKWTYGPMWYRTSMDTESVLGYVCWVSYGWTGDNT